MSLKEASDLLALHVFVRGLRKDLDAVVAGLTLPYSNGPSEGANTKVKLLKRQMYNAQASRCCGSGFCSADRRHHFFCVRAVRRTLPPADAERDNRRPPTRSARSTAPRVSAGRMT
jgi:hypothetical protein